MIKSFTKILILSLIVTAVFVSCDTTSDTTGGATSELVGTWITPCYFDGNNVKKKAVFTENQMTSWRWQYDDAGCTQNETLSNTDGPFTYTIVGPAVTPAGAKKVDASDGVNDMKTIYLLVGTTLTFGDDTGPIGADGYPETLNTYSYIKQ